MEGVVSLVVAVWPNNTISIVQIRRGFTMLDLFALIDNEASPLDANCYQIGSDEDGMHITFDWQHLDDGEKVTRESADVAIGKLFGKIKHLPWPEDILKQWMRQLSHNARRQECVDRGRFLFADEIPKFPCAPPPSHSVCDVRRMPPFCGVYFAFNSDGSCYYIGESEDVTKRVSKSRPEIGDRMIGLVECMPHERKRIEAYFVALLDPPGNGVSSHRMKEKESMDGTPQG
jgi:hypothetical protein